MRPHRVTHRPDILGGHEFGDHVADLGEGARLVANVPPRGGEQPIKIKLRTTLFGNSASGAAQH